MDTFDFINHQNFHSSEDIIEKVNRCTIDWEKIFAVCIPNMQDVLGSLIYVNVKKTNLIKNKVANNVKRNFEMKRRAINVW